MSAIPQKFFIQVKNDNKQQKIHHNSNTIGNFSLLMCQYCMQKNDAIHPGDTNTPMNRVIPHYFPVHNTLGQKKIQKLGKSDPEKVQSTP